jgi:hypothetical protein
MVYNAQMELEQSTNRSDQIMFPYSVDGNVFDCNPTAIDLATVDLSFLQENFLTLMSGRMSEAQKNMQHPAALRMTPPGFLPTNQDSKISLTSEPMFEPERPFAMTLIQSILTKVWTLNLDTKAQQEISQDLHFLLTTSRIRGFIQLYFQYWHPSVPTLHPPSFDPECAITPLLAAVVFMGAMYSTSERETFVARRLLDFVELYIFSTDTFSVENLVVRAYQGCCAQEGQGSDWLHFQTFQAGSIIMATQYWSGSQPSRNRAMETRFGELLRVSLPIRLPSMSVLKTRC